MRRRVGIALGGAALALLAALLPACGVAYPVAVVAFTAGGGGGGGGGDAVTASTALQPVERQRADVLVAYDLTTVDGAPRDVAFAFALPGGAFQTATESPRPAGDGSGRTSDGTSALAPGPHVFVWDSALDLGGAFAVEGVVFRVQAAGGVAEQTAPFTVGNDPPVFVPAALALEQEGLVLVNGALTDSTGDVVDLAVEVVDRADPATILLGAATQLAAPRADDGALAVSLGWNSLADVPENALVTFRVTASDAFDTAPPVDIEVLIQNNDAPSVFIFPIARQATLPATLAVDLRVFDRLEDDVDLDVRFVATNGSATASGTATLVDGATLGVRSDLQGAPLTLVWAIGEDLDGLALTDPLTEVSFEVTPSDVDGTGVTKRARFQVGALAPAAVLAPLGATASGIVPLVVTLTGTGDPADLALTFRRLPSGAPQPLTAAFGATAGLATSAAGVTHTIGWNTIRDLGSGTAAVEVSLVPSSVIGGQTFTGGAASQQTTVANGGAVTALVTAPAAGSIAFARGGAPVPVGFTLFEVQPGLASALIAIDVGDGRGLHPAPGGALAGLATSPDGVRHTFAYDPALDGVVASGGDRPIVRVQVTASGAGGPGAAALGPAFALDVNAPPEVTPLSVGGRALAGALLVSGSVVVEATVRDAEGDAATIEVALSRDQGLTFQPATTAPPVVTTLPGLVQSGVAFALDTQSFGADGPESVILRLTPRDRPGAADPLGLGVAALVLLTVNNDDNPQPIVQPQALGGTASGVVLVPFALSDVLERPCDVAVEVSADGPGGVFVPITGASSPLAGLASSDGLGGAASHVLVWDSRADLGTQVVPDLALRFRATAAAAPPLPARTGPAAIARLSVDNAFEADLVLGQPDLEIGAIDGQGLYDPGRIHVGGARLWVCDRLNHRVLQYDAVPAFDGQAADLTLGRTDLSAGVPSGPSFSRSDLFEPFAVTFDAATQRLFVSDAGQRVLVWSGVPAVNGEAADAQLDIPGTAVGLSAAGDDLYVANTAFDVVQRFAVGAALAQLPASKVVAPSPNLTLSAPINARDVKVLDNQAGFFRLVVADLGAGAGDGALLIWTSRPTADTPPDLTLTAASFVGLNGGAGIAAFTPEAIHLTSGGGLFVFDLAGDGLGGKPAVLALPTADAAGAAAAFRIPDTTLTNLRFGGGRTFSSGIAGDDDRLLVTDAGAHRVLVYDPLPTTETALASAVIGQLAKVTKQAHHAELLGFTLDRPSGVAADANRLYVADTRNARVLVWEPLPDADALAASVVLGQAAFDEEAPNGADPERITFGAPRGVAADGVRLLVSDTTAAGPGQGRILVWLDVDALSNGLPADTALTSIDAAGIAWAPDGAGPVGTLAAAVPDKHAVFVWRGLDLSALVPGGPPPPTFILGQLEVSPGVPAGIPNDPAIADPRARLFAPRGVAFGATTSTLLVADAGNNRVLAYDLTTAATTSPAFRILGQPSAATAPGPEPRFSTPSRTTFAGLPAGIATDPAGRIFVTDAVGHRVLFWDALPSADGAPADGIIGQRRFATSLTQDGGVGPRSLYLFNPGEASGLAPSDNSVPGLAISPDGSGGLLLWLSDSNENRLLRVPLIDP